MTAVAAQAMAQDPAKPPPPIEIPTMKAGTGPPPALLPPARRLGFAIVGLDELALGEVEVLPAFG